MARDILLKLVETIKMQDRQWVGVRNIYHKQIFTDRAIIRREAVRRAAIVSSHRSEIDEIKSMGQQSTTERIGKLEKKH